MPTQPSTADEAGSIGRIVRKLLPAAATVLVAAAAVVGVALVGSAFAGTAAADGTASLDASTVPVNEGGTAVIGVETDGVDEFSVAIGDESESGYELRATVTPAEDGTTSLVFDHAETGGGGTPLTAEGDASVSIDGETGLDEPIAPGAYDVEVSADGDEPADIGTLMVETASTEDGSGDGGSDGDDGSEDGGSADGSADPAVVTESDVEAADVVVEPAETDVTVPVDLADGETVTFRLRSTGDATPAYIKTAEPTVEDGEATATFDLSRASHGDRATLTVRGNDGLDGENEHEVLVVDESIGVEEGGEDGGGDDGTGSADGGGEDDGTDTSVPGFGVVVATLALCATALVANRRSE